MAVRKWVGRAVQVVVALNGPSFISDEDWAVYMRAVRDHRATDPQLLRSRSLAFSDGGSPTAAQRREVVRELEGTKPIAALVSSSRLVRGVGTALSWFWPELKYFGPEQYRRALRHLGVADDEEPSLWRVVEDADREMGLEVIRHVSRRG